MTLVIIDGVEYNAKDFFGSGKHPGGSALPKAFEGSDASAAFHSTHPAYVKRLLLNHKTITRVRKVDPKHDFGFNSEFYRVLRSRVNAIPRAPGWKYALDMLSKLVMMSWTWYRGQFMGEWLWCAVGGVISISWQLNVGHMGNHGGIPGFAPWATVLNSITDSAGGMQCIAWREQHIVKHHFQTNKNGNDPDIENVPFFRFHPDQPWRWWHRYQHVYSHVLMSIFPALKMDFKHAWVSLTGASAKPMERFRWAVAKSFGTLVYLYIPYYYHGIWFAVMSYWLRMISASVVYTHLITPNHINERNMQPTDEKDWFRYQTKTSLTYAPGCWLTNYITGGLNHQIEHHLFPRIGIFDLPAIQPTVQRTIEEYGLEYISSPTIYSALLEFHCWLKKMGIDPGDKQA